MCSLTRIRHNCLIILSEHPRRINGYSVLSRLIMQNCINSLFGQIGRKLKAEGAAGQSLCRASVLLRNQRSHHATFGVSLPPAPDSGSFLVWNDPATLRALSHAPISSALSPNRYRTTLSSKRSCLLMSAATTFRSARAPTCSRRPALVAYSVSSYWGRIVLRGHLLHAANACVMY